MSKLIDPVWSDDDHVIVRDDTIAPGTLLSTTHHIYAPEGSKVEILPDPNPDGEGAEPTIGMDSGGDKDTDRKKVQ